jgi:hypothetical protein
MKSQASLSIIRLKNAVMGAATTAIKHSDNAFNDYYERMVSNGIIPAF